MAPDHEFMEQYDDIHPQHDKQQQQNEHVLQVRALEKQDEPLAQQFRQWLIKNCKTAGVYTYAMTHPATLLYMVLSGGFLQEWLNTIWISLISPPLIFLGLIHLRVQLQVAFKDQALGDFFEVKDLFRYYANSSRRMYVALENNNIVATMACDRKDSKTAVVKHIYVYSGYQCDPVVQKLLENTLRFCKQEHYQRVWFQFTNLQVEALGRNLCKRNGFKWLRDETLLTILPGVSVRWQHFVLDVSRLL